RPRMARGRRFGSCLLALPRRRLGSVALVLAWRVRPGGGGGCCVRARAGVPGPGTAVRAEPAAGRGASAGPGGATPPVGGYLVRPPLIFSGRPGRRPRGRGVGVWASIRGSVRLSPRRIRG